jgi:hypothetical protein
MPMGARWRLSLNSGLAGCPVNFLWKFLLNRPAMPKEAGEQCTAYDCATGKTS